MVSYKESWSSISNEDAKSYLKYYPKNAKRLLIPFIESLDKSVSILEVGCGNCQNFPIYNDHFDNIEYTGIDFSKPLVDAAVEEYGDFENFNVKYCDFYDFFNSNSKKFDIILVYHVMELVESQDLLMYNISKCADYSAILWYEPPVHSYQVVELKGETYSGYTNTPYIRIKTSRDYYDHLLDKYSLDLLETYTLSEKERLDILKT